MFSCEYCEIFKNTNTAENLRATASLLVRDHNYLLMAYFNKCWKNKLENIKMFNYQGFFGWSVTINDLHLWFFFVTNIFKLYLLLLH